MRQAQVVAPLAAGRAAEADARRAPHAKEEVAEQVAINALVPRAWRWRERALPHVAGDEHVLLVIEVERREAAARVGRAQVDFLKNKRVRTRHTTTQDTPEHPRRRNASTHARL